MTIRNYIRTTLLTAMVIISLGGYFLHLRIHPFTQNASFLINFIPGIISIIVVPLLFLNRATLGYGYVLNGVITIIGTIVMTHFSLAHPPEGPLNLAAILLKTTLADILILWGKFFIGKALFDLEIQGYNPLLEKKGTGWRYPHLGWWLIHLVAISVVYAIGALFWR